MPLIELLNTTKLRSLGFGHDQPHGGSSSQPYVQTQIPTDKELPKPSSDFLLRGATNADPFLSTGKDLKRITKWFFSSKGLLFTAKQILLSRTAAATDISSLKLRNGLLNGGRYLPTSTLAQVGVSAFGLHLNKTGINPIPKDEGPEFNFLQDTLSIGSQPLYGSIAYKNNLNDSSFVLTPLLRRISSAINLLGINPGKKVNTSLLAGPNQGPSITNSSDNFLLKLLYGRIYDNIYSSNVYSYSGGPGSILGIGNTTISYATDAGGNIIRTNHRYDSNGYVKGAIAWTNNDLYTAAPYYDVIDGRVANVHKGGITDFRTILRARLFNNNKTTKENVPYWLSDSISTPYTDEYRIETRTLIGDQGIPINFSDTSLNNYNSGVKSDKLNTLGALSLTGLKNQANDVKKEYDKDLITFKIQVIDNDKPTQDNDFVLYFRAFLDTITDQYTSEWDSIQYVGRGEKFYNYKAFDRTISLGWTVAAQSQVELKPMYERLNFLASVCAPDYSTSGYMRGNLVKLTIGGYIYEQVGIIKGFTYEMSSEYPWEIGLAPYDNDMPQLSQVIKVTGFQFIPIHSKVPRRELLSNGNLFIHQATPANSKNTNNGKGNEGLSETAGQLPFNDVNGATNANNIGNTPIKLQEAEISAKKIRRRDKKAMKLQEDVDNIFKEVAKARFVQSTDNDKNTSTVKESPISESEKNFAEYFIKSENDFPEYPPNGPRN